MASKTSKSKTVLRPRFRVARGEEIALGPGKVELLEVLAETGSLNETARRLGMSYMRAWGLVRTMNECFREPVARAERGGIHGGGMIVTSTGRRAVALYRKIESQTIRATAPSWRNLQKLLRP